MESTLEEVWQVRTADIALSPDFSTRVAVPLASSGTSASTGFSIRELRQFARTLTLTDFREQLGPFALVQRPPAPLVAQMALRMGAETTAGGFTREQNTRLFVSLMMEFEYLRVTTLPPLARTDLLTLGRLPDNDLVVDDPSVSKRHAILAWDAQSRRSTLKDAGSSNGTFVNGIRLGIRVATLNDGDLLMFGDASYLFFVTDTLYCKLLNRESPAGTTIG